MVAAVGFRAVGRQGAWWGDAGTLWMEETDTSGGCATADGRRWLRSVQALRTWRSHRQFAGTGVETREVGAVEEEGRGCA